jgi:soluble lytic murein transglycosylase-like protein
VGALRIVIAAILLAAAVPAQAQSVERWRPYIDEASARFGVPAEWIERVMQAESSGRTRLGGRPTTSSAGAMGLMQLMPGTWSAMRARLGLGSDPHAPRDNILAGTLYLRLMHDRFGYPGLFGAYNAGPGRYASYLAGRASLPGETRDYLAAVAGPGWSKSTRRARMPRETNGAEPAVQANGPATIFFIRR